RALLELTWVLGVELYRPDEARRVGVQAAGAAQRGASYPDVRAQLDSALGMTELYAGRFNAAIAHLRSAIEHAQAHELATAVVVDLRGNLASGLLRSGQLEASVEEYRRAIGLAESTDPNATQVARLLNNLGVAY